MSGSRIPDAFEWESEDIMLQTMEYNDLCTTCNFNSHCLERATLQRPVWFCEEFDCYQPAPERTVRSEPSAAVLNSGPEETNGFQGVCMNCDVRGECVRAKQGGTRWYCEEYV